MEWALVFVIFVITIISFSLPFFADSNKRGRDIASEDLDKGLYGDD